MIGGASVANVVIGLARSKVLAVLLGPAGVGLAGLYRGLLTTASTVATMGLDTVGTRQVAEAMSTGEERALVVARKSLLWGTVFLASFGTAAVWLCRRFLADHVLGGGSNSAVAGWIALGVGFTVTASAQTAQIQGMRRIGDVALLTTLGALLSTIVGVIAVWHWGRSAIVFYTLSVPLASLLLGHFFISRLPPLPQYALSLKELSRQWAFLIRIGIPFMGGTLALSAVQLWIQVSVSDALGERALGHFQASWAISTTYIGFVLNAMAADYYPRLTGVIQDRPTAIRLINEQTEIALLLSTPIFLAMIGLAPLAIRIFYSGDFSPAVGILRWQILSDVLKVVAWPLGFIFLAAGDGKTFLWTEISALLVMGGTVAVFLRPIGLDITGIAYLACYLFYLPLMYGLGKRRLGFQWTAPVVRLLVISFVACTAVDLLAVFTRWGGLIGVASAVLFTIYAFGKLSHMSELSGPVGRLGALARRLTSGQGNTLR